MCGYVFMCVCMRVHVCVEKCKAINFPMLHVSGAFGSLAMVAVNIIANLITSDYGRTGPLESLHRADCFSAFFTSTEA